MLSNKKLEKREIKYNINHIIRNEIINRKYLLIIYL